jgi:type IV secretory pathway VirD2 relaxase
VRPTGVQRIVFSAREYPNVRRHFRGALRRGWPRRLVVNRRGADARRDRALRDIPTREGFDRDEYPPRGGARARAGARAWPQPARLEDRRALRAQL